MIRVVVAVALRFVPIFQNVRFFKNLCRIFGFKDAQAIEKAGAPALSGAIIVIERYLFLFSLEMSHVNCDIGFLCLELSLGS